MPCNAGSRSNRTARRGHDVTVPSSKGSNNTGSVKKQPAAVSNNQQACPISVARMVVLQSRHNPSARERDPEQTTDAVGYPCCHRAKEQLPEPRRECASTREERNGGTDQKEDEGAHQQTHHHCARTGQEQKGSNRHDGTAGKQGKRRACRGPRRSS